MHVDQELSDTPRNLAVEIRRSEYTGANPFTYSQARDYTRRKVLTEFIPTSKYWSLLNASNEILVGTRGCGKTILLRMLSYSIYRNHAVVPRKMAESGQQFYGIYVPLRLQLLNELPPDISAAERRLRFRFIFNCVAAGAFLDEIKALIEDRRPHAASGLLATREAIDMLARLWNVPQDAPCSTLDELKQRINELFVQVRLDWGKLDRTGTIFSKGLLEPILAAMNGINRLLVLEPESTTWVACIDEAEYLSRELQASINTILRSANPGMAVKIATLPLHWTESATEDGAASVQTDGDDYRFIELDYQYDSADFHLLTNNLVAVRLREISVFEHGRVNSESAFDDFIGGQHDRSLVSVYQSRVPKFSRHDLWGKVAAELSRRPHRGPTRTPHSGELKRFEPIVLLRELRKMHRVGNTLVAWLCGPAMARRVCGGNARRFIQLCYLYFEAAMHQELTPNSQHRVVVDFSQKFCQRAKAVHREGFLLHDFLTTLAKYLEHAMHSGPVKDVGLGFRLAPNLFRHRRFIEAIEAGIAYSYILRPDDEAFTPISPSSNLRLANAFGALKWLPMRFGASTLVSSPKTIVSLERGRTILSANEANAAIGALQLDLFDTEEG